MQITYNYCEELMKKELLKINISNISVDALHQHCRLTHKILSDCLVSEIDLSRSLLSHCNFQNIDFINCNIESADIIEVRFINCRFINTVFANSDINSTSFESCSFVHVDFNRANIIDSIFISVTIEESLFPSTSIYTSRFERCHLNELITSEASLNSNDFLDCIFTKCKLLNSFYYCIFNKCKFNETIIDSYIMGFQYGIKKCNYTNSSIEHFGNLNIYAWLSKLKNIYRERGMFFQLATTDFITSKKEGESLVALYQIICSQIKGNQTVRLDDIRFLRRLTMHLYNKKSIDYVFFLKIISLVTELYENMLHKQRKNITSLYNEMIVLFASLNLIYKEIIAQIDENNAILFDCSKELDYLKICITYKEKPALRLSDISEKIIGESAFEILDEYSGCFIEELKVIFNDANTTLSFIAALVTLFDFGRKIIKAIVKYAQKEKKLHFNTKKYDILRHELVLTNAQTTMIEYKKTQEETIRYFLNESNVIVEYSKNNIEHICIKKK